MASKVSSDYMRRQSICVFAATEESAANDLARSLIAGADAIDRLAQIERRVRELAETYESMRFPYLHHADDCAKQLRALIDPPGDT